MREERVAIDAYLGMGRTEQVGEAVVVLTPEASGSPMLNRVVGLGLGTPATVEQVDAALAAIPTGTTYYVAVAPGARPAELPDWLAERGLEPGWGWMLFRRGVGDAPDVPSSLEIRPVATDAHRRAFAEIVRQGYELPPAAVDAVARAFGSGWECWLAWDGPMPVSAAGLYCKDGVGYLGFAATLPEARGKGAQSALLATRIHRAAERGCDVVVTETGERREGHPSNSYRNILRAGFEEVAVTANWRGRS